MKKVIFLILSLLSLQPIAAQRSRSEALKYATAWFSHHAAGARMGAPHSPSQQQEKHFVEREYQRAYTFQRGEEFVLVDKDEKLSPILGYGRIKAAVQPQATVLPPALTAMLNQTNAATHIYPIDGANWTPVAPLLTTIRHQLYPYNKYCPYYKDDEGDVSEERCMVGCVATAMEQILTYYRRTYTLQDTLHGWSTDHYTIADVMPGESVDTRLILNNYDTVSAITSEEEDAVARLSYYLGVASHMNYGLDASGTSSSRLEEPLRRAFGLKTVNYLDSYKYAPLAWWNYLAHEIMAHRPVYFAGSISSTAGHAFVLDGLDEDGLFHVNWGYGGNYDGFFRLDVLCSQQPEDERKQWTDDGYFCNHEAITLCPDEITDNLPPDTLSRTGREIVIDSLWLSDSAVSKCQTRVCIAVHNTSTQALTTPFALLLNLPSDTAYIAQADWLAFTGCTLPPNGRDTLTIHTRFTKMGNCLLSLTPDGEQIVKTLPIHVGEGGSRTFQCAAPTLSFPEETTLSLSQPIFNPSLTERAAWDFTITLSNDTQGTDVAKVCHVYLQPQQDTILTVRFSSLPLGCNYTLQIHRGWDLMQSAQFSLPTNPQGISSVSADADPSLSASPSYYTLDGRSISASSLPSYHGIVIKRTANRTEKIILQ